jgi:hypothetical protein
MKSTEKKRPARDPKDQFYIDFDHEFNVWGVFGDRSGHCYATFSDKEDSSSE